MISKSILVLALSAAFLVGTIFSSINLIPAFAENPTPYQEYDFDFTNFDVYQDSKDIEKLVISTNVTYKGKIRTGVANVNVIITDPAGETQTLFGSSGSMEIGDVRYLKFIHEMTLEGRYDVRVEMTPPSKPYLDHIFDNETASYFIPPLGLERQLKVMGKDLGDEIVYYPQSPEDIRIDKVVHVIINLPKVHTFEGILITSDKFTKDFDANIENIYLQTDVSFEDMKVIVLKEGNPYFIDAQPLQNYVSLYLVSDSICSSKDCVTINDVTNVKPDEFPWMFLFQWL